MPKLVMKYIFLKKSNYVKIEENTFEIQTSPIGNMLQKLFENVTENSFEVQLLDKMNTIYYKKTNKKKGDTLYLSVEVSGTSSYCAQILNCVHLKLIKGEHRKNYHIVLIFDGVSEYYCNKIYCKFNLFERKIRELVFNIIIKAFGVDWYNLSLTDELKDKLKEQTHGINESKLIESALYEMTIYQLESYLFTPYTESDLINLLNTELGQEALENKSKDEIVAILHKCKPLSLWDRFFAAEIRITNLDSSLEKIRNYRNNVAHNKYFYKDDYDQSKKILNKLNRQLDSAIDEIENRTFNKINVSQSLSVLNETLSEMARIVAALVLPSIPALESMSKLLINFAGVLPKIQFDTSNMAFIRNAQLDALKAEIIEKAKVPSAFNEQLKALQFEISEKAKVPSAFNEQLKALQSEISEKAKVPSAFNEQLKALQSEISEKAKVPSAFNEQLKVLQSEVSEKTEGVSAFNEQLNPIESETANLTWENKLVDE